MGGSSDFYGLPGGYYHFGSCERVLKGAMVQPVVPSQNFPLVPSQEVLNRPQLGHFLTCGLGYYHVHVRLLQVIGNLGWDLSQSWEVLS